MTSLTSLWLPILLAAVAVFFWSFLSWALLNLHKKDFVGAPNEDGLMNAVRQLSIPPGVYGFPHCGSHANARDPAFMEKWKTGPAGMLYVWTPNINMGANMAKSFLVQLVVSVLVGYVGSLTMAPGTSFGRVMQVLGTAGILSYTFAFLPNMIWFQASTNAKVTCVLDGLVSGLLTGLMFALLWPK